MNQDEASRATIHHRLLDPLRDAYIRVLLAGPVSDAEAEVWTGYFRNATFVRVSTDDVAALAQLGREYAPFGVVIDKTANATMVTRYLPDLQAGGVYVLDLAQDGLPGSVLPHGLRDLLACLVAGGQLDHAMRDNAFARSCALILDTIILCPGGAILQRRP